MTRRSVHPENAAGSAGDPRDASWTSVDWSRWQRDHVLGGRRLHYVDVGSGPAVVLVHGQGGSWQFWLRVICPLAQRYRVIAVDLPGFGASDTAVGDDVIDEQLTVLADLLIRLGVVGAVMVGHSMGGLVTMRIATEKSGLVSGVVLVDAGGSPIGPKRLSLILTAFRLFNGVFRNRTVALFVAGHPSLFTPMFAAAISDRRAMSVALARQILPRMATPGFIATMKSAAASLSSVAPQHVTHPVLVVWGERDRILPVSGGRALAARIPRARFESIAGVGHCPMIESPDRLVRLVLEFVDDVVDIGEEPASGA